MSARCVSYCRYASQLLKRSWFDNVRNAIQRECQSAPAESWMFLDQYKTKESYENSKLQRFLRSVTLMMEDSLRIMTDKSCREFVEFVEQLSAWTVSFKSLKQVENVYGRTLKPDDISPFPLFSLGLVLDVDNFDWSTSLEDLSGAASRPFANGLESLHDIASVEQSLLPRLFPRQKLVLKSVSKDDAEIAGMAQQLADRCAEQIKNLAFVPEALTPFLALLRLDEGKHLAEFKESAPSVEKIREEVNKFLTWKTKVWHGIPYSTVAWYPGILYHRRDCRLGSVRGQVKEEIPVELVIGMFHVSCELVRSNLVQKCDELAQQLLQILSENAQKKVAEITEQYEKIHDKLEKRPETVEELSDTRDYMRQIPKLQQPIEEQIDAMIVEFDTLEDFKFALPDDVFRVRLRHTRPIRRGAPETAAHTGAVECVSSAR